MGVRVREKVQGSGEFWVFIHHEGRRTSRRVGDQGAAEEVAKQIQARLTLGRDAFPAPKPKLPTLEEYYGHIVRSYLQTATRPKTQLSYETSFKVHILPKFGTRQLDKITKANVRDLISELVGKGLAKATIQTIIRELCAVFNRAIGEDELISKNPASKCSEFYKQAPVRHKQIEPLNPEEVRLFLRTVRNREASRKYYPLFLCAIHTGLRSSEIAGLQWGDIDWNGKFLMVRRAIVLGRTLPTKTDKDRRVDLSDALLEALRAHRQAMREKWLKKGWSEIPKWIFANQKGKPANMDNVKLRHFYPNLAKAGLRRIRFHDLRHTFASLLIQNGEPLAYVRDQLGHSSIKMTVDVYGHLEPGRNRQAVNKLPTINDAPAEPMEKTGSG